MVEDDKFVRQSIAHALLSPLTVILGSLEMLLNQEGDWPGYAVEIMELAMAQAQRLHDTLDALLSTAEVQDDTVLLYWSLFAPYTETRSAQEQAESPEIDKHEESV